MVCYDEDDNALTPVALVAPSDGRFLSFYIFVQVLFSVKMLIDLFVRIYVAQNSLRR